MKRIDPAGSLHIGTFSEEEIREGACHYCKVKIPEPIIALWSLLEWEEAGDILHNDENKPELYNVSPGTITI